MSIEQTFDQPWASEEPVDSGSSEASFARIWLTKELLPVSGGEVGFLILFATITLHMWIALLGPNSEGHLFRCGVLGEAFGLSFILVAPMLSIYAGFRSQRRNRDALFPYITIIGGGIMSMVTVFACILALMS